MTVVEADRPEFGKLVSPDAALTKIGEGYEFSEGPVWSVAEQALYFSDIPGDKRFRWTEPGGMELVLAPTF
jgi:gluconolactonase